MDIVFSQFSFYSGFLRFPKLGPSNKRHVADPKKMGRKIVQNILFAVFEKLLSDFRLVALSRWEVGETVGMAENLWWK